jgi:DNA-binding MarR family transcriptional regulator
VLEGERLATWTRFLKAHSAITRRLERDLAVAHGLTLSGYDVLIQLMHAPGGRLRPVELAKAVVLTRSGITRLVQGLERAGLVERVDCPEDARGFLVALTPGGLELVRRARATHLEGVAELFSDRYTEDELETLSGLLERLPDASV